MRSLLVSVEINKFSRKSPVILEIAADDSTADQLLMREVRNTVMAAWSPEILLQPGSKVEDFVERRLDIGSCEMRIECGQRAGSAARHRLRDVH